MGNGRDKNFTKLFCLFAMRTCRDRQIYTVRKSLYVEDCRMSRRRSLKCCDTRQWDPWVWHIVRWETLKLAAILYPQSQR